MRNFILIALLGVITTLSSCSKQGVDNTAAWVGVYQSGPGAAVQQVVVSKASDNSLKIVIKKLDTSYLYAAVILQNATIAAPTQAKINEQHEIIEYTGTYQINGDVTISGSRLTLTANAINKLTNNESDTKTYSFIGDKIQ